MAQLIFPCAQTVFYLFGADMGSLLRKANSRVWYKNLDLAFYAEITGCIAHKCLSAFLTLRPYTRPREKKKRHDMYAPERISKNSPQEWRSCHRFL